jgi:putative transposase
MLAAAGRSSGGYRRLHILLRREGLTPNHKKLRRIYAEERLQVRRRGGRKRALGTKAPLVLPHGPTQRWSLDFLHDQLGSAVTRPTACALLRGSAHQHMCF